MCDVLNLLITRTIKFRSDESGAITAFVAVVFLLMFVAVGMAVDFMRHETYRTELQGAVDRGVLAAASLSQTTDAEQTVRAYIQAANFVDKDYSLFFDEKRTLGSNKITATAHYELPTFFLKVIGINSMEVVAHGVAYEGVSNIEISLALDISGSMARERTAVSENSLTLVSAYQFGDDLSWGGVSTNISRMDLMRVSASQFIDMLLDGTNKTTTSINLIPFAGQVNPGEWAYKRYTNTKRHDFSKCIDFVSSDFDTSALPPRKTRKQTPHFQYFLYEADSGHQAEWGWCPSDKQSIEYLSNDATKLKNRIAKFRAHDGTGTQNAMKWALGLLDPGSNGFVKTLVKKDVVSEEFGDRPTAFNTDDTMKVIILMSDGGTTEQYQPNEDTLPTGHMTQNSEIGRSYRWSSDLLQYWPSDYSEYVTRIDARNELLALCDIAEAKNVIVFTIGFDINVDSYAYDDLKACASEDPFFFDVNGTKLSDAFSSIASTITRLRLVQ